MNYKKISIAIYILLLIVNTLKAQQTGIPINNIPQITNSNNPYHYCEIYNNMDVRFDKLNFIETWIPDQPVTFKDSSIKYRQLFEYYDGLGREFQKVNVKGHADGKNIIEQYVYDTAGRQKIKYLPYVHQLNTVSEKFDFNPEWNYNVFYQANNSEFPLFKVDYDNSPLNKVVKSYSPGYNWVGNNRGVVISELTNNTLNSLFLIENTTIPKPIKNSFPNFVFKNNEVQNNGSYDDNELFILKKVDEDGKISETIKNKYGNVVISRIRNNYSTNELIYAAPSNYDYTFYIYDELQRLRLVIPPNILTTTLINSSNSISFNWSMPTINEINNLCYSYKYDNRARIIEKKVPDRSIEYFIYDKRNRLIAIQDGNLRINNKWHISLYDNLNRNTISGIVTSSQTREQIQHLIDNDNYNNNQWLYYVINDSLTGNALYPNLIDNTEIMNINYYDDYTLVGGSNYNASKIPNLPLNDNTVVPSIINNVDPKGLITCVKSKILNNPYNSNMWIVTKNYYDINGRIIQQSSTNIHGDISYNSNIYYFQGMLFQSVLNHKNSQANPLPSATSALNDIKIDNKYKRNLSVGGGNDQIWQIQQTINNGMPYNLAYYEYDHMNRIVLKQYSVANVLNEYNIKGWIKNIHARSNYDPSINFFNEKLYYDTGFSSKIYNGNISGIKWSYYNEDENMRQNCYGYNYDYQDRLMHAEYRNNVNNPSSWVKNNLDYSVSNLSYDKRGNILTMDQRGNINGNPIDMDKLVYEYKSNSNQLNKVTDNSTINTTILPDFKDSANELNEYTYDDNGNLLQDKNKNISNIIYNYLNLPERILVANKGEIINTYDASGKKIRKKIINYNNPNHDEIWDYMDGLIYKNNILQYVQNEEGRARPEVILTGNQQGSTKFVYDYFIKDHLGNVRSTINAEPNAQQYYAQHEIASANVEQLVFENIATVRSDKPGSSNPNDTKAIRLNANEENRRVGTAIILRVMPGDKLSIATDAYYIESDVSEGSNTSSEQIFNSLLAVFSGGTSGGVPISETKDKLHLIENVLGNQDNINIFNNIINQTDYNVATPKAGLNYLFFNDYMQLDPSLSNIIPINPQPNVFSNISFDIPVVTIPGYILLFVDNKSFGKDAWFDNVQVSHFNGNVISEDHYYPFGLTISTSGFGVQQPYKFQTKELERSFGLETYDFHARQYDPQLGRFNSVDPMAHLREWVSPYNFCQNNPINRVDPTGALDGDFYNSSGQRLGSDAKNDNKAYIADGKNSDGSFKNARLLNISNSGLNQFANTIAIESGAEKSGSWQESFGIGLAIRNIANSKNKTILQTMETEGIFGFRDGGNSTSYKNNAEFSMQAALYSVLDGFDFTLGATKWDGIDFLAWGLNSPDGTPHNKFEEYGAIYIESSIYSNYKRSITNTMGNSARYYGKSYSLPAPVFENMSNWKMPSLSIPWMGFMYSTGIKTSKSLEATSSFGNTIFWKEIRE